MKHLKLILTVCIAVCAAAFACMFAACDNTNEPADEPATSLTVTVLLEEGTPAVGVGVGVCDMDGMCLQQINTNDSGIAVIDLSGGKIKSDKMEIHLYFVPEGYAYCDANGKPYLTDLLEDGEHGMQIPNTQSTLTITLKKVAA